MTIDVLDSGYPLMTLLKEKAPGTYAHSKNVALLIEVVGHELGLDVDSLKIAGTYHDIGKTLNPEYFAENQTNDENILNDLDPWVAYKVVTSHVGDTTQILINDPNISREVVEYCSQHHGSSVMTYFYNKSNATSVDMYRYKCTNPTTLEAGLLMICDHLEARSKSRFQIGKIQNDRDIDELVELVLNELMADEQLDNITLKLGHLRLIKEILKRELRSSYHKRPDYDGMIKKVITPIITPITTTIKTTNKSEITESSKIRDTNEFDM